METIFNRVFDKTNVKIYLLDLLALAAIYFVPTFSHMLSIPLYLVEPMRLALVASIIFTNRNNAYIIALTLPAFSYFISSHPVFIKTLLISSELVLNVFLFYHFKNKIQNTTLVFALSIIAAKLYYYFIKLFLLQFALLQGALVSTPIIIQIVMVFVFTASFHFLFSRNK